MKPHWDTEIARIEAATAEMVAKDKLPAAASIGVAVDDAEKRDYFVPRLQRMIDKHRWPVIFRVFTVSDGSHSIDVAAKP